MSGHVYISLLFSSENKFEGEELSVASEKFACSVA